jgi:hypothetical protein
MLSRKIKYEGHNKKKIKQINHNKT